MATVALKQAVPQAGVTVRERLHGSASRWQNHRLPHTTAFVAELPRRVGEALVVRGVTAIYKLASELASPGVEAAEPPS
jgi:hypothetical protein